MSFVQKWMKLEIIMLNKNKLDQERQILNVLSHIQNLEFENE
jgi:hypothetical protein